MWAATLGQQLTLENAVLEHLVIVLHEITHAMSGIHNCTPELWDPFIKRILQEGSFQRQTQ